MRLETPVAHRDADPRVGARRQLGAESVALGAEGEERARRQRERIERLAVGVEREQRPVSSLELPERAQARDRQREVQAGRAAQRVGVPGVVGAGR